MNNNNGRWALFVRVASLAWAVALPIVGWMLLSIIELREFRATVERMDPAIERRLVGVETEIRELRQDVTRLIAILELRLGAE